MQPIFAVLSVLARNPALVDSYPFEAIEGGMRLVKGLLCDLCVPCGDSYARDFRFSQRR